MGRIRGFDARPGDLVRHSDGTEVHIKERKVGSASYPLRGWWLVEGGGLSDRAIDLGEWTIVREAD